MANIRNFCIVAHIDHGKSTLADRMLEVTGTVEKRKMKEQVLDKMDLERERGITIKLAPVTMNYEYKNSKSKTLNTKQIQNSNVANSKLATESLEFSALDLEFADSKYTLNLIDTPGHVDFTYEVSRSLAAVEGAVLLVDASQGIQAQTIANLYLAIEQNLVIIPVVNKIDLPAADVPGTKREIIKLLGCKEEEILTASGKTGAGVPEILQAVIERVPPPSGGNEKKFRALIFDSNYDEYRGVVAYIRVVDGELKKGNRIRLFATGAKSEAIDVGIFKPDYFSTGHLAVGEIGYIVTSFKDVSECRVGDTVVLEHSENVEPLKGYNEVRPMVYAGIFPKEGNEYQQLREAIAKLKLNDAALAYEPEQSQALGFGFRCGFLGLLHLEIFQERLRREHNIELIVTIPSVSYQVKKTNGEELVARSPQMLPNPSESAEILEPWVKLDIVTPKEYLGAIMNYSQEKRGVYKNTEYLDEARALLHYEIPLAAILTDYYDKLKSLSSGYGSINYEYLDHRRADVVKMDILVAEEIVEALSSIVYKDEAFRRGKEVVSVLKDNLPKQMFVIKIQAAIGGKVIAAERISALRKDVTAKLYGGDVTRKRKLLEKQKKGKKKMMAAGKGSVEIPSDTFVKILKR
jgi:GTP-binding protein LepA